MVVTCDVKSSDTFDENTLVVKSDCCSNDVKLILPNKAEITVDGIELIKAVNNCMNT